MPFSPTSTRITNAGVSTFGITVNWYENPPSRDIAGEMVDALLDEIEKSDATPAVTPLLSLGTITHSIGTKYRTMVLARQVNVEAVVGIP